MADGASNPLPVPTGAAKTPSDFLKSIKGKPVLVKLNSGVDYRGKLSESALFTAEAYGCMCQLLLQVCSARCKLCTILTCTNGSAQPVKRVNHVTMAAEVLTEHPPAALPCRHPRVPRWLHEYCHGTHRGEHTSPAHSSSPYVQHTDRKSSAATALLGSDRNRQVCTAATSRGFWVLGMFSVLSESAKGPTLERQSVSI
jgi:hypothetical protein